MQRLAPDSAETHELLERADQGDRSAFDRLFAKHRSVLRQMVELRMDDRLRTRLDPSDVVQETHVDALRRFDGYLQRRPMPFRLWLRRTAHERLIKLREQHLEAARRTVQREVPLPDRSSIQLADCLLGGSPSPSRELQRRELAARVRLALAQLPEDDREILLMRYVEGLSNQEAALVLDLEPAAASKRHGRALVRLRQLVFQSGLTESQL